MSQKDRKFEIRNSDLSEELEPVPRAQSAPRTDVALDDEQTCESILSYTQRTDTQPETQAIDTQSGYAAKPLTSSLLSASLDLSLAEVPADARLEGGHYLREDLVTAKDCLRGRESVGNEESALSIAHAISLTGDPRDGRGFRP